MSIATDFPAEPRTVKGTLWALVPVALLAVSTLGVGTMASIAARDPGFALERNYYDRAVHWDRQQAQWAENERLRYGLLLDAVPADDGVALVLRLSERGGGPLTGASVRAEAFANARAGEVLDLLLVEQAPGRYETKLHAPRPGLWELRLAVTRGSEHFSEVVRVDLGGKGAAP
jgi:hypothetical protein